MKYITSEEFRKVTESKNACILPAGSYEQHGPHDILETDYILSEAIADKVSKICDIPVLPAIPYGISYVHRTFPGTIYISDETYMLYVFDILSSLKENGIKKVYIINAHGANHNMLKKASDKCQDAEFEVDIFDWFELIGDEFFPKMHRSHAGSMETSALLALDNNYVRLDKVENMDENKEYKHTVISDIRECTFNGVIGFADQYSREKGEQVIQIAAKKIAERIIL